MKKAGKTKVRKRKAGRKNPRKPSVRGLTPRQKLFIGEYTKDMNATRAYLRAGYKVSEKVAQANSARMLSNAIISTAINDALGRRLGRMDISNDTVLQEIAKLAFGNMMDYIKIQADGTAYIDLSNLTREQAAAIHELSFEEAMDGNGDDARQIKKVKFKLADKKGNLELLGKYLKLFNETTPVINPEMQAIMNEVVAGTMPVKNAAYKINSLGMPLPEAVKIDFTKQVPVPPDTTQGAVTNDEIMKRYAEQMRLVGEQIAVVMPERAVVVADMKKDLESRDMFVDGEQ